MNKNESLTKIGHLDATFGFGKWETAGVNSTTNLELEMRSKELVSNGPGDMTQQTSMESTHFQPGIQQVNVTHYKAVRSSSGMRDEHRSSNASIYKEPEFFNVPLPTSRPADKHPFMNKYKTPVSFSQGREWLMSYKKAKRMMPLHALKK